MASTTNPIFTGSSQFSSDFQQVIQRAVSLASLPMQQVQNNVTDLQNQSSELSTLNSRFSDLESAIQALDSAAGSGSFSASVSNSGIASATVSGTPYAGSYSLEVDNVGSYSTSMSSDGLATVTDPTAGSLSDATRYSLSVGSAQFTISPSSNSLTALADAINLSGANAQATVVNIGSATSPDYRLSLQGTKLGDLPIQLTSLNGSNPNQSLLDLGPAGAPASYKIDGKPPLGIQSDSDTVTISPGLAATLVAGGTTTVSVNRSTAAISNALQNLVTAYNAVQAEIGKNRGQGTGGLNGQSILQQLSGTLEGVLQYSTGTSGISSLTSLGITSDKNGVLSFDGSTFASATAGNLDQLASFLGSAAKGGFLKSVSDSLNALTDPSSGAITTAINSAQDRITTDNQTISNDQDKVNRLQTNLQQQLAAADAAIATMEQQFLYLNEMFTAMQQNKTG
jgi:flagellar hook-associated protein 2